MSHLRLHPDSFDVLEQWWSSDQTSPADRLLITQLLTDLETGGLPATRFLHDRDLVHRERTNVLPREGLAVVVQMYTDEPDYFRIVSITTLTRHPDA